MLLAPGDKVADAVVIAGLSARHRTCEAEWSKKGDHPLSRGVFVGPQKGNIYGVGGIPIIAYVFFYLILFGLDEILWLVINSVLGILMIHGWLETLALPFIPEPGTVGTHIIRADPAGPIRRVTRRA